MYWYYWMEGALALTLLVIIVWMIWREKGR